MGHRTTRKVSCLSLLADADDICRLRKTLRPHGKCVVGRMLDEPMPMLKREHGLARKVEDD